MQELPAADKVRLDKWLWAARFFKTRSLAAEEIGKGRVSVNGQPAKASRELRAGDEVEFRQGTVPRTVRVHGLSEVRGPAPLAQGLYEETAASLALRQGLSEQRRQGVEPAHAIDPARQTKRDRRQLADWQRWSASIDADPEPER